MLVHKAGEKPIFTDSELLTLMVAQDFMPHGSESRYIGYLRANYGYLFRHLLDQSEYTRRARSLWRLVEAVRQEWLRGLVLQPQILK